MYEPPPGYKGERAAYDRSLAHARLCTTDGTEPDTEPKIDLSKLTMSQLKALPMHEKFAFLKGAPQEHRQAALSPRP